ncbi:hypothetical protein ACA910_022439 [Epithemia clementina (nom. ined.)]
MIQPATLVVEARIYVNYYDKHGKEQQNVYPSVPSLRNGLPWEEGVQYQAQLLSIPHEEFPTYCGASDGGKFNSFVLFPPNNKDKDNSIQSSISSLLSSSSLPIALVAGMGDCSIGQVVEMATKMLDDESSLLLRFLIVYGDSYRDVEDKNDHDNPTNKNNVSTGSKIRIQWVTNATAKELIRYTKKEAQPTKKPNEDSKLRMIVLDSFVETTTTDSSFSSPLSPDSSNNIQRDDDPSHRPFVEEDDNEESIFGLEDSPFYYYYGNDNNDSDTKTMSTMDPNLGLFFMIMLLSSVLFLCVALAQQRHIRQVSLERRRMALASRGEETIRTGESSSSLHNQSGNSPLVGRHVLTMQDIERYILSKTKHEHQDENCEAQELVSPTALASSATTSSSMMTPHSRACAICLEDLDSSLRQEGSSLDRNHFQLPCHHVYHADCILPWLTERSGTCPLCKFDVYQHVQEASALDFSLPPHWIHAIARVRRQLWQFIVYISSSTTTTIAESSLSSSSSSSLFVTVPTHPQDPTIITATRPTATTRTRTVELEMTEPQSSLPSLADEGG